MLTSILWSALFFLLGAATGSFINLVTDRLPEGKSIISPPSYCPGCQRRLATKDLFPIISYLLLKGRCRYCGTTIPIRLFLVELSTAALFVFLFWHYGISWHLGIVAFYCCLFTVLLIIDFEHNVLPNKIVFTGMAIALSLALTAEFIPSINQPGLKSAAIGGAIGFGLLCLPALISRRGMGWGDVKLAGLIGLVTGFPLILLAMFLAMVTGGLTASILLLLKVKRRGDMIPFGPFLSLATLVTLFWGNNLLKWFNLS